MTDVSREALCRGGPALSRLIMGAWRLADREWTPNELDALVDECLQCGITTFDHADIYADHACETLFGRVLQRHPEWREHMQLIGKCGIRLPGQGDDAVRVKHYDSSPGHVRTAVEDSLRALRTDCLDVLLIHRPDPLMDPDETARALERLQAEGKVRHLGVSNFTPEQFALLQSRLQEPLVTNQIELSVLRPEPLFDGTVDDLQRRGVAPMAWSALAGGRVLNGRDDTARRVRTALERVASELGGAGADQVALAWLLRHRAPIFPLVGSGTPQRVRNAAQSARLRLPRQAWFEILEAAVGSEVP